MKIFKICYILFAVFLINCSSDGPLIGTVDEDKNFIRGEVVLSDGSLLTNSDVILRHVTVTNESDTVVTEYYTKTDENGAFTFTNIPGGYYVILYGQERIYLKSFTVDEDKSQEFGSIHDTDKKVIVFEAFGLDTDNKVVVPGSDIVAQRYGSRYVFSNIPEGDLNIAFFNAGRVYCYSVNVEAVDSDTVYLYEVDFANVKNSLSYDVFLSGNNIYHVPLKDYSAEDGSLIDLNSNQSVVKYYKHDLDGNKIYFLPKFNEVVLATLDLSMFERGQLLQINNFPLAVNLVDNEIDFSRTNEDGSDIRIFSIDAEIIFDYEIEYWNIDESKGAIWINIDGFEEFLNDDNSFDFVINYSNRYAQSVETEVFLSQYGFNSVYHLSEIANDDSVVFHDATDNQRDANAFVVSIGKEGVVGLGQELNGELGDVIEFTNFELLGEDFTYSSWFRWIEFFEIARTIRFSTDNVRYRVVFDSTHYNGMVLVAYNVENDMQYEYLIDADFDKYTQWTNIHFIVENNIAKFYVNGILAREPIEMFSQQTENHIPLRTNRIFGFTDELRFYDVPVSATWVKLSYETQNPENSLLNFISF